MFIDRDSTISFSSVGAASAHFAPAELAEFTQRSYKQAAPTELITEG